jgi:hypothetical protein
MIIGDITAIENEFTNLKYFLVGCDLNSTKTKYKISTRFTKKSYLII